MPFAGQGLSDTKVSPCLDHRSPLSYFDDKPIGRLLSRFSQDLYILDFECMMFFNNCSGLSIEMLTNAIIIVVAGKW